MYRRPSGLRLLPAGAVSVTRGGGSPSAGPTTRSGRRSGRRVGPTRIPARLRRRRHKVKCGTKCPKPLRSSVAFKGGALIATVVLPLTGRRPSPRKMAGVPSRALDPALDHGAALPWAAAMLAQREAEERPLRPGHGRIRRATIRPWPDSVGRATTATLPKRDRVSLLGYPEVSPSASLGDNSTLRRIPRNMT